MVLCTSYCDGDRYKITLPQQKLGESKFHPNMNAFVDFHATSSCTGITIPGLYESGLYATRRNPTGRNPLPGWMTRYTQENTQLIKLGSKLIKIHHLTDNEA